MDLVLWRWSVGVQISSLAVIAFFFVALQRSLPRDAIAAWVNGWLFNFAALAIALIFWVYVPSDALRPVAFFLFMAPKNLAVLYLVEGAWSLHRPGTRLVRPVSLGLAGGALPLAGALTLDSIARLGTFEQALIGIALFAAAVALFRTRDRALRWLAAGFGVRGGLCLLEAAAYATQLTPEGWIPPALLERMSIFLAVHSSFDTGAEWLLALGFVLAISLRSQRALEASVGDLREAQEGLRRLVDHDPLTSLSNRRALPGILRAAQPEGATLLFFDLDDFKRVNDELGHEAGDLCLRRFADALRECFRPGDAYVRYGGDEFLVVAPGLDGDRANERVEALRGRLGHPEDRQVGLSFSVGVATLGPGGKPEDALKAADARMYEAKARRTHVK